MKKLFSLLAIVAIIMVSNCTRIPENNDPVIGLWSKVDVSSLDDNKSQTVRQEWIFNDVYLGRYHKYDSKELVLKTDFQWSQEDGQYTISYPGTDLPSKHVIMKASTNGELLQDIQGNIIAERQ
jgi:hypothetical protein